MDFEFGRFPHDPWRPLSRGFCGTPKWHSPVEFVDGFVHPIDTSPYSWMYAVHARHPRFPLYIVGSDGAVWSNRKGCIRRVNPGPVTENPWRMLKFCRAGFYRSVNLYVEGEKGGSVCNVHRAVIETFGFDIPAGKIVCRHLNGNPIDNRIQNLSWGTAKDNRMDDFRNRREYWASGSKNCNAKLTSDKVREAAILVKSGRSIASVAREMGISRTSMSAAVTGKTWGSVDAERVESKTRVPGARFTEDEDCRIVEMRSSGMLTMEIAKKIGRHHGSVLNRIKKLCPPELHSIPYTGTRNHFSRLTENDVIRIRDLRSEGVMVKDICKEFGISRDSVRKIASGEYWKHVPLRPGRQR